jgi:haloalkane dehalogenase
LATVEVLGSRLHYVEAGQGDPVLFLHGNPTSSYLWRNVIGQVAATGRHCLALDLIGMGKSGKPELDCRLTDHIAYVDAFVERLALSDLTLVGHDWGAVIALDHQRRFPDRVKGVCFLEGHIHPIASWDDLDEGGRQLFTQLRTPGVAERLILEENLFIEKVLPAGIVRTLTEQELDTYRSPYEDPASRSPMLRWPQEIPIAGEPADVVELVQANQAVITDPDAANLLLYGEPGAVIGADEVEWCRANGRNLTVASVGTGIHFLPEDQPDRIAVALTAWLNELLGDAEHWAPGSEG